jgi:disulfide oxidoreductase YuzD
MTDLYESYTCDECRKKVVSSVGNPLYGRDNLDLCADCVEGYIPRADRTCDFCGATDTDTSVEYSKFKTTVGAARICAPCIDLDSTEQTHLIIKKL